MARFETQYPLTAREKEIKEVLRLVSRGQSCQIISVPGAGRSTILRLLAYHPKLIEHYLGDKTTSLHFVYLNFAEIASFELFELYKFLFLSLLISLEEKKSLHDEIYPLFK